MLDFLAKNSVSQPTADDRRLTTDDNPNPMELDMTLRQAYARLDSAIRGGREERIRAAAADAMRAEDRQRERQHKLAKQALDMAIARKLPFARCAGFLGVSC